MPRPHKPSPYEIELSRKIHGLQIKLLQANATLRLKVLYCEKLECLLRNRNNRIDQLFGLLEQARSANQRLERECKHLASMIAASPDNASILATH
jgi:septation ring formation regulator EzrA